MKFLDPDHPFFAVPWRRWATAIVPFCWGLGELWWGNPGWALIFCGAGAYAFWELILRRPSGK